MNKISTTGTSSRGLGKITRPNVSHLRLHLFAIHPKQRLNPHYQTRHALE